MCLDEPVEFAVKNSVMGVSKVNLICYLQDT